MSRASTSQPRNLTLTEELEKLEQSITLTLQEIDHNFSRAHRIVTSSILPIVEQYAEQSKNVWEGSKFWKQFFESSANVSLSGYEEQPAEATEETYTEGTHSSLEGEASTYETPSSEHFDLQPQSQLSAEEDLDLSNLTLSPAHSTPRPPTSKANPTKASFADYPSPYETLRQELVATSSPLTEAPLSAGGPSTPGKSAALRDHSAAIATSPGDHSPFLPPTTRAFNPPPSTQRRDPLLHRVLDRNYRVQATPHTASRRNGTNVLGTASKKTPTRSKYALDSSPLSSPDMAPPELHAEIFSSPIRKGLTPGRRKAPKPGVSVLTPARLKRGAGLGSARKSAKKTPIERWNFDDESVNPRTGRNNDGWEDSDDSDEGMPFGQSPPKTMTFHVPQRRLLRTPAKEASKRIVSDLLLSAGHGGGGVDDDLTDDVEDVRYDMNEPTSPSIVRAAMGLEDESF